MEEILGLFCCGWLVCGIIGAIIGQSKGQGVAGFFCGAILGPLGIVLMLFSKGNRGECPYCKEWVKDGATVCPHCQKNIHQ